MPEHCRPITESHRNPCAIYIYTPPQSKAKPPGGPKPKLVLVPQNDPRCLMLANATTVGQGQQAPLTLAAPLQGHAICRAFEERRVAFGEWKYTALAIGPAAQAVTCALIDGKLVEGVTQGVVTPSMLNVHEGNHFDFVWGPNHPKGLHKEAAKKGNALDLVINDDRTISPKHASHLVLGLEFAPWKTAKQPNASVQRASQRNLLASAKGGPSCEECEA